MDLMTSTKWVAFGLGTPELIVIVLIVVLLFGASRIPALGKSVGQGLKNFKQGLRDAEEEDDKAKLEAEEAKRLEAKSASEAVIEGETKKQNA